MGRALMSVCRDLVSRPVWSPFTCRDALEARGFSPWLRNSGWFWKGLRVQVSTLGSPQTGIQCLVYSHSQEVTIICLAGREVGKGTKEEETAVHVLSGTDWDPRRRRWCVGRSTKQLTCAPVQWLLPVTIPSAKWPLPYPACQWVRLSVRTQGSIQFRKSMAFSLSWVQNSPPGYFSRSPLQVGPFEASAHIGFYSFWKSSVGRKTVLRTFV